MALLRRHNREIVRFEFELHVQIRSKKIITNKNNIVYFDYLVQYPLYTHK